MIATERCWRYHPEEEARIFEPGEDIPKGWVDTPDKFGQAEEKTIDAMDKKELEAHALTYGVELDRRKSKANMLKDFEAALHDGR